MRFAVWSDLPGLQSLPSQAGTVAVTLLFRAWTMPSGALSIGHGEALPRQLIACSQRCQQQWAANRRRSRLSAAAWGLIAGLLLSATAQALPVDPYFESVGDADSIPDNNVSALTQDRQGFLWIGTPDGLLRYDGYRFKPYDQVLGDRTSLGGDFIRALLTSRDGRIWIGSNADGVAVLASDGQSVSHFRQSAADLPGLSHNTVRAFAEDERGRIWIGTRSGLDEWDPQSNQIRQHRQRLGAETSANDEHIMALLADSRGNLWVGSWGGLSVRRVGDQRHQRVLASAPDGTSLQGELVQSLIELDDGRIIAGSAGAGAFLLSADGSSLSRIPVVSDAGFGNPAVLSMLQPNPQTLWIAVLGGIEVVDAHSLQLITTIHPDPALRSSLANDQIRALLRDHTGQVWVGGYGGGLQRHDPNNEAIQVIRHSPSRPRSLSLPSISSVLEVDPQTWWIGTRGNGVDIWDRQEGLTGGIRAQSEGGLRNGIVSALSEGQPGERWIGTQDGLYRYQVDGGTLQLLDMDQGLPNAYVRRLLHTDDGLWIGTDGGLALLPPGESQILGMMEDSGSASRDDINAIGRDADGRYWIGSSAGLYTIAPGHRRLSPVATRVGAEPVALAVLGLLIDSRNQLWIDSPTGLFKAGPLGTAMDLNLQPISTAHGFAGQPFGANLLEDQGGRIWTQRFVYDPSEDSMYELSRADGADFGTAWFRAYTRTAQGELLFGGSKGLMRINPHRFARWAQVPPLVFTDVQIDGQETRIPVAGEPLTVSAQQRGFAIEYAALDFTAPLRNRYAHRLVGFDDDWVNTDATRRVASYTSLSPGSYQLQVRGSGRTGELLGAGLSLPIEVLPAWWQRGWLRLLMVVLIAAVIYLGMRLRTRRIEQHSAQLEAMVAERTAELSAAKESAEQALVQLSGAQRELVSRERLASLGQLVAGVAHEINTPVGVARTASTFVNDRCQALAGALKDGKLQRKELDEFVAQTGQAARMIDHNLARASELVRNFKQVSVDRSRDDRRRFDLSQCLLAVVSSLELTWKRRPVELQLALAAEVEMDSYPGALGQVVSNLIQNALIHGFGEDGGGVMRLSTERIADGRVRIEFRDDGKGVSEAELTQLFEPFYTTRRAQGGSGLGLHIVFNLVHSQLGGTIRAHPDPNRGLRFVIELPVAGPSD